MMRFLHVTPSAIFAEESAYGIESSLGKVAIVFAVILPLVGGFSLSAHAVGHAMLYKLPFCSPSVDHVVM